MASTVQSMRNLLHRAKSNAAQSGYADTMVRDDQTRIGRQAYKSSLSVDQSTQPRDLTANDRIAVADARGHSQSGGTRTRRASDPEQGTLQRLGDYVKRGRERVMNWTRGASDPTDTRARSKPTFSQRRHEKMTRVYDVQPPSVASSAQLLPNDWMTPEPSRQSFIMSPQQAAECMSIITAVQSVMFQHMVQQSRNQSQVPGSLVFLVVAPHPHSSPSANFTAAGPSAFPSYRRVPTSNRARFPYAPDPSASDSRRPERIVQGRPVVDRRTDRGGVSNLGLIQSAFTGDPRQFLTQGEQYGIPERSLRTGRGPSVYKPSVYGPSVYV